MWQRLTDNAQNSIFRAQEEAEGFGQDFVCTEHLLLGLIQQPDCTAALVLVTLNVPLEVIRREIVKIVPQGVPAKNEQMRMTSRAKRVIDLAYEESRPMGSQNIGTEHLLLGLISEHDGTASRVLTSFGLRLDVVRREVLRTPVKRPRPE